MKKFILNLFLFFLFYIGLSSCVSFRDSVLNTSSKFSKKIYVKPFINNVKQFGLEVKFTNIFINELLNDGRFSLVNVEEEADVILVVKVEKYVLELLISDDEFYRLWVVIDVLFIDKDSDTILWHETMKCMQIFTKKFKNDLTNNLVDDSISEAKAREFVWERLSRNIIRKMILKKS
ncbi:MAG: LPS assembly lipoprotein LptE [Endomicrobium sp.]|jgi:hypothetical protein|nr:LPS assembly lipoprotein LptE [Endomicrobium sp.]